MRPHPPDEEIPGWEDDPEEFSAFEEMLILTDRGLEKLTPMECPICNHAWTAQHPPATVELECPSCEYMVNRLDHEII